MFVLSQVFRVTGDVLKVCMTDSCDDILRFKNEVTLKSIRQRDGIRWRQRTKLKCASLCEKLKKPRIFRLYGAFHRAKIEVQFYVASLHFIAILIRYIFWRNPRVYSLLCVRLIVLMGEKSIIWFTYIFITEIFVLNMRIYLHGIDKYISSGTGIAITATKFQVS